MCLPESPKEGELAKQRRSFSTKSLPINKREKKLRAGREISVYLFSDKEYVAQRCIINEWPKEIKQRPGLPTPTSLPFHLLGGFQIGFPRGSLEKMVEESPVQWADSDSLILSTMFKQSFLVVSPINTHTHTHTTSAQYFTWSKFLSLKLSLKNTALYHISIYLCFTYSKKLGLVLKTYCQTQKAFFSQ